MQRFLRSAPQLSPEQQCEEAAPPPGREMEVSIESDDCAAFFGLGQSDSLVVLDAEWQLNAEVDPALVRVHVDDFERDRPFAPQRSG